MYHKIDVCTDCDWIEENKRAFNVFKNNKNILETYKQKSLESNEFSRYLDIFKIQSPLHNNLFKGINFIKDLDEKIVKSTSENPIKLENIFRKIVPKYMRFVQNNKYH